MRESEDELRPGTRAYREYDFALEGESGSIAITLGRLDADTVYGRFARYAGARAYGLVSILGQSSASLSPLIWVQIGSKLGVTSEGDGVMSPALKSIVALYLARFFNEIAPNAPELASFSVQAERRGDRSQN